MTRTTFWKRCSLLVLAVLLAACCSLAPADEMPDVTVPEDRIDTPTFGDDRVVAALGELLGDPDVRVREQACRDLGQTHNAAALASLRRATEDASPLVRAAAVTAAGEIGGEQAGPLVLGGLGDGEPAVVLAALRSWERLRPDGAAKEVLPVLGREEPLVQAVALQVLTRLNKAAPPERWSALLASDSPRVRLRAAENARLLVAPGWTLPEQYRQIARTDPVPAVRAAAVEVAGCLDDKLLAEAAGDDDPRIRRAAVRCYAFRRDAAAVAGFLDDASGRVRLAALRAGSDLPLRDAIETLFKRMRTSPDEASHLAARDALLAVGGQEAARLSALALPELVEQAKALRTRRESAMKRAGRADKAGRGKGRGRKPPPPAGPSPAQLGRRIELSERNAVACAHLLGELRSRAGHADVLRLLETLRLDSPVLGELALTAGALGDDRAGPILRKRLEESHKVGFAYLRAMMVMANPPPFSEDSAGKLVRGSLMLGDSDAIPLVLKLGRLSMQGQRLTGVCTRVVRSLGEFPDARQRKPIRQYILDVLKDRSFGLVAQLNAADLAGRWKLRQAVGDLEYLLTERRPNRRAMLIAARAIGRITGTVPPVGQPVLNQGDWVVQVLKDKSDDGGSP
jgi:hypothetical protein